MPRPQTFPNAREDILAFFYGYEEDHGVPPTIQEAVDHWNATHEVKVTLGFIHNYIRGLVKEGRLVDLGTLYRRWGAPRPDQSASVPNADGTTGGGGQVPSAPQVDDPELPV